MSASLLERGVRPAGSRVWVKLSEVPEMTSGGILLPASAREQWNDGEVIAVGLGRRYDDGFRPPRHSRNSPHYPAENMRWVEPWAEVGSRVVFNKWRSKVVSLREKISVVRDEDLLGVVLNDGEVEPLNDYLLLSFPERRTETAGGIALPEIKQTRPNSGVILAVGPGLLRESGPLIGTRKSVINIMGFAFPQMLEGRTVWFDPKAEVWDVGRASVERWLVRAGDCVAIEGAA